MRKIVEIFNRIDEKEGRKALTSFYIVGVLGYALPFSRAFFIEIIPLALLFNGLMLFGFHRPYNWKHISIFSVVFLLGWVIEVLGVKTGVVFGDYSYGPALGLKVCDVPLLIGVNWLMLVYASLSIARYFIKSTVLSALFASFIMVVYDYVMEPVAVKMNMWKWVEEGIPPQNFVAWYFIALVFCLLFGIFKINTKNGVAVTVFVSQFVFFTLLNLIL